MLGFCEKKKDNQEKKEINFWKKIQGFGIKFLLISGVLLVLAGAGVVGSSYYLAQKYDQDILNAFHQNQEMSPEDLPDQYRPYFRTIHESGYEINFLEYEGENPKGERVVIFPGNAGLWGFGDSEIQKLKERTSKFWIMLYPGQYSNQEIQNDISYVQEYANIFISHITKENNTKTEDISLLGISTGVYFVLYLGGQYNFERIVGVNPFNKVTQIFENYLEVPSKYEAEVPSDLQDIFNFAKMPVIYQTITPLTLYFLQLYDNEKVAKDVLSGNQVVIYLPEPYTDEYSPKDEPMKGFCKEFPNPGDQKCVNGDYEGHHSLPANFEDILSPSP